MRSAIASFLLTILTAGTVAAQSATAPQSVLKATHGSWEVWCYADDDCIMTQLHRRTNQTADAVFTIFKPKGLQDERGSPVQALAEIVVPLGVFLPGALGLQIDTNEPRAVPFERCIPDGCVVRAPIAPSMLDQMRAGATAHLIVSPSPEERVKLPISLNGFTAAFNSL